MDILQFYTKPSTHSKQINQMHNVHILTYPLPWTKWQPLRRRYFQKHFREWKGLNFIKRSPKCIPKGPMDPSLVGWWLGDQPLSERMRTDPLTHICGTRRRWVNLPAQLFWQNSLPVSCLAAIPGLSMFQFLVVSVSNLLYNHPLHHFIRKDQCSYPAASDCKYIYIYIYILVCIGCPDWHMLR